MKQILVLLTIILPFLALAQDNIEQQLSHQFYSLQDARKYDEAITVRKQLLKIHEDQKDSSRISEDWLNIAEMQFQKFDIAEALNSCKKSIYNRKSAYGAAYICNEYGKYFEAAEMQEIAVADYRKALLDTANRNGVLYKQYLADRDTSETSYGNFKRVQWTEYIEYYLWRLSCYYANGGNYTDAIRVVKETINVFPNSYPDFEHDNKFGGYYSRPVYKMANAYGELLNYYTILGEKEKGISAFESYVNSVYSMDSIMHFVGLHSWETEPVLTYFDISGQYDKELQLAQEMYNGWEQEGRGPADFSDFLKVIAGCQKNLGQFSEAIESYKKYMPSYSNIDSLKNSSQDPSSFYESIYILSSIAHCYSKINNLDSAIIYQEKALELAKLTRDETTSFSSAVALANYYHLSGQSSKAFQLMAESMTDMQNDIKNSFANLTSSNRETLWNEISANFTTDFPRFAYKAKNKNVSQMLYDKSALFSKGLLLSTDIEVKKLIQESGDEELSKLYQSFLDKKSVLNAILSGGKYGEMEINTDSLKSVIDVQEKELLSKCKVYGDYTKSICTTWKDVQQHLGKKDLAVEFLSFPTGNDSTMYIALTLCKNDTAPQMVTLFEQEQITSLCDTIDIERQHLKELIWDKMYEQLKGIKNIYFAAAGQLHNIGIEYLPGMEDYNIYRLSSTRELVNRKEELKPMNAVLYGNIDYNTDVNEMADASKKAKVEPEENYAYVSSNRSVNWRSLRGMGVEPLPATKVEIKNVEKALETNKISCAVFDQSNATEESFKALSGKKTQLLHIATHGFYFSEKEAEELGNMKFLQLKDKPSAIKEDKSMTRSGLCFSGANNTFDDDSIPEGVDDGILTAQEIAQVDLRGLDLVVLSACQTACGDINQGEGVFGLQRGFKKAGAQSLMMSLRPVDDEATQILMSEFYNQYTSGKTKRDAFQTAQQHLRTVQNGKYNHPKYWAAFILLDAID